MRFALFIGFVGVQNSMVTSQGHGVSIRLLVNLSSGDNEEIIFNR